MENSRLKAYQIDLGRSIAGRKKIYLDIRFWIILREAAAGRDASVAARNLLDLLRRGVRSGLLVCPISESTFIELMKQNNTLTRRIATARIIDELSLGTSIIDLESRIAIEIEQLLSVTTVQNRDHHRMQNFVWTKLSYALGDIPEVPHLPASSVVEMREFMLDKMWNITLSEMVEAIGDRWEQLAKEQHLAAQNIKKDIKAHTDRLISYEATYRDETVGIAEAFAYLATRIMAAEARHAGIIPPDAHSNAWKKITQKYATILGRAFESPATKEILPTMHTLASLHAALRWDKNTNFTSNHFYDFAHAAAALSYCDAFFTDGFIAQIANARHTQLMELNKCQVTSDIDRAVTIVRKLSSAFPE